MKSKIYGVLSTLVATMVLAVPALNAQSRLVADVPFGFYVGDKAMAAGLISSTLPFAKKKGVEILKVNYLSRDEAAQKIPAAFTKYYQDTYPAIYAQRQAEITASGYRSLPGSPADCGRRED